MKFVIQRVSKAKVIINKKIYSSINKGLLLLAGFESTDTELNFDYYANKIANLRIFNDSMNKTTVISETRRIFHPPRMLGDKINTSIRNDDLFDFG